MDQSIEEFEIMFDKTCHNIIKDKCIRNLILNTDIINSPENIQKNMFISCINQYSKFFLTIMEEMQVEDD